MFGISGATKTKTKIHSHSEFITNLLILSRNAVRITVFLILTQKKPYAGSTKKKNKK